jgi:hypothetical protein
MIFDLKLLAIVEACKEWRAWLMGTEEPVKMFLDHSNLLYFKTAKQLSPKQARWVLFLDNFNMLIHHVAGKQNPVDAPSRREDFTQGKAIVLESHFIKDKLVANELAEVAQGEKLDQFVGYHDLSFQRPNKDLLMYFEKHYSQSKLYKKEVILIDGVRWLQGRVFVPEVLRLQLIGLYHDSPTVGHPGVARTFSVMMRTFAWHGMRKMVTDFVRSCDLCQRVKARQQAKDGKLVSIVAGPKPWSTIGMDMITKLPTS